MKELFNTLSSISNFFNEKRFIFGAEQPSNDQPKVSPGKIEFPEIVVRGEKPGKTMEFPEIVIKANIQKKGKELLAGSKLNKLMDMAIAQDKKDQELEGLMKFAQGEKVEDEVNDGLDDESADELMAEIDTQESGNRIIGEEILIKAGSSNNEELDNALQGAVAQRPEESSGLSGLNLAGEQQKIIAEVDKAAQGQGVQVAQLDINKAK